MVAGTGQAYGINKATVLGVIVYIAILAVNVLPLCGLAWFDHRNDQQKDQRELVLDEVSEANRRLEATLAENAGLHEQLLTQAREAGILDERQRMAREIHDTLAQGLTGIITQLQAAEQASDDPAGWRRHFEAATRLARESLSEARRSVDALRPEPLETGRLPAALADVADRWSALHGIAVQVTTTGTARPMPPEAEVALLRTAQEGLANVARHAQAANAWVTLSYMEQEVALDVRDDGKGFDRPRPTGSAWSRCGSASRDCRARCRSNRNREPARRSRPASRSRAGRAAREPPRGRSADRSRSAGAAEVTAARPRRPIKLLIVDDHPVVRDGLSAMFARDPEFEVLGEAADGAEAVRLALALAPDVILMDLRMPGMDGLTAITELGKRGSAARVLVLTTYDTDSHVLPAIEAGATGYLLKDAPRAELLRAVRAAARGEAVLSPSVATRLMSRFRAPSGAGPLSQRELEVLELVAAGTTNREAAARLFISEATVKTHLLNIYAKLGVSDRAAAVGEAFNRGLLTPQAPERP